VANRAGIARDVSPHVLRHTFAATALQKAISLPTVQKILGHASLQTAIYLNFTDVHIRDEFERKWWEPADPGLSSKLDSSCLVSAPMLLDPRLLELERAGPPQVTPASPGERGFQACSSARRPGRRMQEPSPVPKGRRGELNP
jgi:hypothetical protein